MSQINDSILEKIQKLMALEERGGTPAESANAAARISEMLLKYNLSLSDVKNHKVDDNDIFVAQGKYDDFQTPYDGNFAKDLLTTIARFNFCRVITITNRQNHGEFKIFGKEYNVQVASFMFDYCLTSIKTLFNGHWFMAQFETLDKKNVYKRGYYQGAVLALRSRLTIQKEEAVKVYGEQKMNGLVIVNDQAIEKKIAELFDVSKMTNSRKQKLHKNSDALMQGYDAGKKLNLSKGLENTKEQKRLQLS